MDWQWSSLSKELQQEILLTIEKLTGLQRAKASWKVEPMNDADSVSFLLDLGLIHCPITALPIALQERLSSALLGTIPTIISADQWQSILFR